ncbi:hypothetical protein ACI797_21355 [Geodermatophilus sp. SYSU D00691]
MPVHRRRRVQPLPAADQPPQLGGGDRTEQPAVGVGERERQLATLGSGEAERADAAEQLGWPGAPG